MFMLERHYDDYFLDRDPVIPVCDQCDEELPESPVETWTKEEPVGEYEGELMYDTVEYRRYTCLHCNEDTVLNNL